MLFRIDKSVVHGVGWIATCDIPADRPILDEEVTIRFQMDPLTRALDKANIESQVSLLSKDKRDELLDLSGNDLLDKIWMNGSPLVDFNNDPLGIGPSKELGIYLKCARINHSCIPNAVRVNDKGNIISVVSQKDIAKGEEITISYLDDNFASTKDRGRQMSSKIRVGCYWDRCMCKLCTGPESIRRASDERRLKLFSYRQELIRGRLDPTTLVGEFLPLMKEEGLPTSSMGVEANMKFFELAFGSRDWKATSSVESVNEASFGTAGLKVVLHKLKAKPELNGQKGVVVHPFNTVTGRVGILLDSSEVRNKPIAVKPENLVLQK